MFRSIVFSALGAGIVVGVCLTAIQLFTTVPLILRAEVYEYLSLHMHGPEDSMTSADRTELALERDAMENIVLRNEPWEPSDGLERTLYTALANLVVGAGASLMLLGLMVAKGETIDARRGVLWGVGGFLAASLLPSLGLPPELPGTPAAEIASRQIWWIATAIASAAGLGLMIFGQGWLLRAAGVALLIVPHLVGAPAPLTLHVDYPAGLAGEFVVASLVASCLLWCLSGLVGGWLHQRLARPG